MIEIKDVQLWYRSDGIYHVVESTVYGWMHSLCDIMATGLGVHKLPAKARICRKCRERLKRATISKERDV